jgi:hypothetical protein
MGQMKNSYKILLGKSEERKPFCTDVLWSIILKWVFKKEIEDMELVQLAQDRFQWQAFVNTVLNIWVPERCDIL